MFRSRAGFLEDFYHGLLTPGVAEDTATVWEAQRCPNCRITAKLVLQVFSTPVKTSSTSATKQIPLPSHSPCQQLGCGGKCVDLWIRGRPECKVLPVKDVWDVKCSLNSFGNTHLVSVLQKRIRASVKQQCTMRFLLKFRLWTPETSLYSET